MKRLRRHDYYEVPTFDGQCNISDENNFNLQNRNTKIRHENTLEAAVLDGDTLQAIALRFHCTISDIKRLNKIDRDNEIFARKVIRVPISASSILLDTLPLVHKSGNNSPNNEKEVSINSINKPGLNANQSDFNEKLILASVNNATFVNQKNISHNVSELDNNDREVSASEPLLLGDENEITFPATLKPPRNDFFSWSGSDCDLNWIFLLLFILLICVIVPLIYVVLVAEHPENFHPQHSRFDDDEPKHHISNSVQLMNGTHPVS